MTIRGRRTGPVLKGICPECGELRHLRTGGVMGQHKKIYRRHYRSTYPCAGVDQPAAIYGPHPKSERDHPVTDHAEPLPERPIDVVRRHLRVNGFDPDPLTEAYAGALAELLPALAMLPSAKIVRVQPGDVIAIKLDHLVSDLEADEIIAQAEGAFPGHRVVIVERGDIDVVRPTTD